MTPLKKKNGMSSFEMGEFPLSDLMDVIKVLVLVEGFQISQTYNTTILRLDYNTKHYLCLFFYISIFQIYKLVYTYLAVDIYECI